MNQIRFQPLAQTHQQLSTMLCKLALSFQTTDYTAAAEWLCLIRQVKKTHTIFRKHAEVEENILFPLLHDYEPALVAILCDEQCKRMHYLKALNELFISKQAATDKQKSMLFSNKSLYRMDTFIASTVQQMNEAERMINPVLWKYCSDKVLKQMAASFSIFTPIPQRKNEDFFADSIFKNMIPSTIHTPAYKDCLLTKVYQQHRASKDLAFAI